MAHFKKAAEIKVGVVGYGGAFNMGLAHLSQMRDVGMVPTAVAEIDPERLAVAEKDFPGIERYDSVDAMVKSSDVKLVAIITPHNTHAELALKCLKAGIHVVCEKPLAITTAECDRMLAAAEKNNLVLSTYHNRHWDGCILHAVKSIRKDRVIGDVVRIEARFGAHGRPGDWWRSSRSISGGIMYDWGVHLLEYALQLMDDEIVEVSGFAHNGHWATRTPWKDDTNEDEGMAVVRFRSGRYILLRITQLDADPRPGLLTITGTDGSYLMDHNRWEIVTPRDGEVLRRSGPAPQGEGWRFYRNIADHLVKGTPLVITPQWARRPIHILDLARQSAEKGTALKAKYP